MNTSRKQRRDSPRAGLSSNSSERPHEPLREKQRFPGGKRPYVSPPDTRLERQRTMSLTEMLADLSTQCDIGGKRSSSGNTKYWSGYKLHLDVADGQIPISAVLTSASVHDSQVAIPLATMTTQRVTDCYAVMDSAYDASRGDDVRCTSMYAGHRPFYRLHQRR